jgi:hypothetical protein
MVSWFRFFAEYWRVFCAENSPDEHRLAAAAHDDFLAVKSMDDLLNWTKNYENVPGVFLIARNKVGRDGKRKIDVIHHVRPIRRTGGRDVGYVVGILQLGGGGQTSGILVKDLLADLVPVAAKKSNTRGGKDSTLYVPTLGSVIEGRDRSFGKGFVPAGGEDCLTTDDLSGRPSGVFIPFYMWMTLCKGTYPAASMPKNEGEATDDQEPGSEDEDDDDDDDDVAGDLSSDEEEEIWTDRANSPLDLARSLCRRMGTLQESDTEIYDVYRGVAQNLLDFLWAANNNLTPGVRLRSTEGDLEALRHTSDCLRKIVMFSEEGGLAEWGRQDVRDSLPPLPRGTVRPPGEPPVESGTATNGPAWVRSLLQDLAGTMTDVGLAIKEAAQAQKSATEKESDKKRAAAKWLPDSLFVLKVLSAENGWATPGVPELNRLASTLFEMKLLQAILFVRAKSRDDGWAGCILKSGLSEFLKRGPIAEDINEAPSGFSVLFFHHSAYAEGDDESHSMQALRESYGDGEMPDDLVKAFSRLHIFVPTCTFRAGEQIKAAIQFLETVCGEKTLATSGYRQGLRLLEEHRRVFDREAGKDKMFLLNYLYLLDRIFQRFCKEIREFKEEQDPVLSLRDILKGDRWMIEMVNQAMEPLIIFGKELGFRPPLQLQEQSSLSGLVDMSQMGKGPNKRQAEKLEGGGKAGGRPAKKRFGAVEADQDWWTELKNADYVSEWAIPREKKFGDFFGPHKKGNVVGLPYVQHHKTKRPAPICLKYQLRNSGKCKRGGDCALAHIQPKDLSSEEYQHITDHLEKVFSTGDQA